VLVEAGLVDDLPEAEPTPRRVGNRELVLVRWRGTVYALRNLCPHMSKSFELGDVLPRAIGSVGGPAFSAGEPVMTCPWHQYEYALDSGRCLTDLRLRIAAYPTRIENGRILVDVSRPLSS
jgi:3-phenylpropionate/trans-cinnamate dioxygenase ferredoxin subunit